MVAAILVGFDGVGFAGAVEEGEASCLAGVAAEAGLFRTGQHGSDETVVHDHGFERAVDDDFQRQRAGGGEGGDLLGCCFEGSCRLDGAPGFKPSGGEGIEKVEGVVGLDRQG